MLSILAVQECGASTATLIPDKRDCIQHSFILLKLYPIATFDLLFWLQIWCYSI